MALEVFYSYSHKDDDLRKELETHLALMVRSGLIKPWSDRRIEPGDEWRNQIDEHVRTAHIILLLISPDFLASDYCWDIEMKIALERHEREHAIVIPILLRPVDWSGAPFANLQALPREAKAVTLWANRDQAFAEIAQALRETVLRYQRPVTTPEVTQVVLADRADETKARVLDAAMPSHVVKDRAAELLVLIRLPESAGLKGVLQADEEADARPEDVRSKPFEVAFPLNPLGKPQPLKVSIEVTAPDFQPALQRKNLLVPVAADSEVCPFMLTPVRLGQLTVEIELAWEDAQRGCRRLRTSCVAEVESAGVQPVTSVVQMPLLVGREETAPQVMAAVARGGSYPVMPPALASAFPAPAAAVVTESATAKAGSLWSSPGLKVAALALCVISLGSFFLVQRSVTTTGSPVNSPMVVNPAAAPPPVEAARNSGIESVGIEDVAKEFDTAAATYKKQAALSPEIAAALEKGKKSLEEARTAQKNGKQLAVAKYLDQVREATETLNAK
jgi:hypothetical protein